MIGDNNEERKRKRKNKEICMKYKIGDIVYVYLFELKKTILKADLIPNRFGEIINIEEIGKDMYVYTVKNIEGTNITVKNYDKSFDLCNVDELINILYNSNLTKERKDKMMNIVNDMVKKLK